MPNYSVSIDDLDFRIVNSPSREAAIALLAYFKHCEPDADLWLDGDDSEYQPEAMFINCVFVSTSVEPWR